MQTNTIVLATQFIDLFQEDLGLLFILGLFIRQMVQNKCTIGTLWDMKICTPSNVMYNSGYALVVHDI